MTRAVIKALGIAEAACGQTPHTIFITSSATSFGAICAAAAEQADTVAVAAPDRTSTSAACSVAAGDARSFAAARSAA
jgi:hypothetical protein